jgi:hypothetical protein
MACPLLSSGQEDTMTEIRLEQRTPPIWPWLVVGVAALIAIVWWGLAGTREVSEDLASTTAATTPMSPPPDPFATSAPVNEYLTFVSQSRVEPGLEHNYTAAGVRKLTAALAALTRDDADLRDELESLRQQADALQADSRALTHSEHARDIFTSAAALMTQIQQKRAADAAAVRDQIGKVRDAAVAVREDRRLLDQKAEVERFFQTAAEAVSALDQALGAKA